VDCTTEVGSRWELPVPRLQLPTSCGQTHGKVSLRHLARSPAKTARRRGSGRARGVHERRICAAKRPLEKLRLLFQTPAQPVQFFCRDREVFPHLLGRATFTVRRPERCIRWSLHGSSPPREKEMVPCSHAQGGVFILVFHEPIAAGYAGSRLHARPVPSQVKGVRNANRNSSNFA
jgi:hypothetical protein